MNNYMYQNYITYTSVSQLRPSSAGEDKRVAVWEAWSWKEQGRSKPFVKGGADSLCFSPRAGAATGAEPCIMLASGERPAVWGMCALYFSVAPVRHVSSIAASLRTKDNTLKGIAKSGHPAHGACSEAVLSHALSEPEYRCCIVLGLGVPQ